MFAVVEILGQQFKVEKDQKLVVNRLDQKEGSKISFENVLLVDNGKEFDLGNPTIEGYFIEAKIIKHLKGDKVIVFKKKRRKGYKVKKGHKQYLSEILIESISKNKIQKKVKVKKASSKETTKKNLEVKEEKFKLDLKLKTLGELKDIAKSKKITGYSSMKKSDLIKILDSIN